MTVHIDCRGAALWLTIDRPEKRNAMNDAVLAAIREGLAQAEADPQVVAVVLTGEGDKAFCSGADLDPNRSPFAQGIGQTRQPGGETFRALMHCAKPVIARVNGVCLAGGMGLMAAADFAIAADDARFGLPEVKVGVFPMMVAALLIHRLGLRDRDLTELALLGEMVSAERALAMGLLTRVVPRAGLDAAVEEMVAALAERSPTALRMGKHAMAQMREMGGEQALAFAEAQIRLLGLTDDAREGIAAFAEKRRPNWSGT